MTAGVKCTPVGVDYSFPRLSYRHFIRINTIVRCNPGRLSTECSTLNRL